MRMNANLKLVLALSALAALAGCGGPQAFPGGDGALHFQGEGVRGFLLEARYDPAALRYLGAEGGFLLESYAPEPGRLRLAGVSYTPQSGEVLRLRFQALRPGASPEVRVLESLGGPLRPAQTASGPAPQGLRSLALTPLPGVDQSEVAPDFAQNPLGDLNGSGAVSLADALLLADLLSGAESPTPYRRYHGDLDSNGQVDEQDVVRLLRKLVNPSLGAGLEVAPLRLALNPGESAYVLVGNSGNEPLPPLVLEAAPGLSVAEETPSGYAGRVYRVAASQSVSQGALLFRAGNQARAVAVNGTAPDFLLGLSGTPTGPVGGTAQATLTLTPLNGFTGTVSLSLVDPPAGVSLSPAGLIVSGPDPVDLPLTLTLDPGLAPQDYPLTLRASGGSRTREVQFTLKATDFALAGSPALTLPWGGMGSLGVAVLPQNGFATPLNLALKRQDGTPLPPGLALTTPTLPPSGGPVGLQVQNPPPGDYPLRLEATPQGGGATRSLDFTLTVTYSPEWRVVLSWTSGADLDLHLFYPDTPAAHHVYWQNPGVCPPAGEACLEGDTLQGPGQEALRFTSTGGSYRVYVHWYFGGGSWATAGAQVQVFNAGYPVGSFPAPGDPGGYGTWWHVLTVGPGGLEAGSGVAGIAPQGGLTPLGLPQKPGRR
ncbi:hypothetical protein SAMN04488243_1732 [Thermus arciformis]|uniref:Dockerin domain-containing protein n=2 Tax=Thermus arciformis TaxID=482827 RepID=A0A1G7LQ24_9DEIN|nr:hypothetical protein SAMN04488243_1732 [Thermus arciformis]